MKTNGIPVMLLALTAAACGGSTEGTDDARALADYRALGQQMSTEVATYAAATATLPGVVACDAAHADYQAAMAGMVQRMRQMSDAMDRHMAGMGHGDADMTCMADAMAAELARHHAVACRGADVTADEQEAGAHVAAMGRFLEHQRMRYEDAGSAMGMMSHPEGSTFTCRELAGGSFTFDGEAWTPGMSVPTSGACTDAACVGGPWPMPCGGMMCGGGMGM